MVMRPDVGVLSPAYPYGQDPFCWTENWGHILPPMNGHLPAGPALPVTEPDSPASFSASILCSDSLSSFIKGERRGAETDH